MAFTVAAEFAAFVLFEHVEGDTCEDVGTLGDAVTRRRLAKAFGKDLPVALLENVAAIVISIVAISRF